MTAISKRVDVTARGRLAGAVAGVVLFAALLATSAGAAVAPNRSFADDDAAQVALSASEEGLAAASALDEVLLEDDAYDQDTVPGSVLPPAESVPAIALSHEEGRLLVEIDPAYSAAQVSDILQQFDYVATKQLDEDDIMFGFAVLYLQEGVTVEQALAALEQAEFALSAQPDYVYYPFADGDDIDYDDPFIQAFDEAAMDAAAEDASDDVADGDESAEVAGDAGDAEADDAVVGAEGEPVPVAEGSSEEDAEAFQADADVVAAPEGEQPADGSAVESDQAATSEAADPQPEERPNGSAVTAADPELDDNDVMSAQDESTMTAQAAARKTTNDAGLAKQWTDTAYGVSRRNDWSLEMMHVYEAWSVVTTNKKVTVAVLDSGCYVSHPDLKANIVAQYNAVSGGTDVSDIMSNTHGTHVAGIIAAEANNGVGAAGVSYNAGVLPIKVMHKDSSGQTVVSTSDAVKAYNYLLSGNAAVAKRYNVRVVNMSLGKPLSKMKVTDPNDIALVNAVNQANANGIVTVCAAGNVSAPTIFFPVDFSDSIVGVINVDTNKKRVTGSLGSNYNVVVDGKLQTSKSISAPGSAIYSTVYADKYGRIGGTSMAAPNISGVLALMFAANGNLTPDAARSILYSTAEDIGPKGFDAEYGNGLVNAYAAVSACNVYLSGSESVAKGSTIKVSPSAGSASGWKSSNTAVATVDGSGNVRGVGGGSANITATVNGMSVSKNVKVYDASISGAASTTVGGKVTYTLSSTPAGTWTWSSSNAKVATVNANTGAVAGVGAGTATITATLSSNSAIKVSKNITINKLTLTNANVAGIESQPYTGSQVKPAVKVVAGGKVLTAGTDYTVTYSNNVNVGTATATVTGKGSYAGTVNKQFAIAKKGAAQWGRLYGNVALDTMSAIIDEGKFASGGTVVLVTNAGYWDALTAAGLAGLADGPVLMTNGQELSSQTSAQLKKLKPKKIIVCGGPAAVTDSVANAAARAANNGTSWSRIWGNNATDTANQIFLQGAKQVGKSFGDTAFVCTSQGFYDALSAAPVSYAQGMPIFLVVNANTITTETLSAMKTGGIKQVYIVGGTAAISDSVRKAIENNGIKVAGRIWGQNAIETSSNVAQYGLTLGMSANNMGVATMSSYYDALSGAALCGTKNSVLVLVGGPSSSTITGFISNNSKRISTAYVFGGKFAVDDDTLNAIKNVTK